MSFVVPLTSHVCCVVCDIGLYVSVNTRSGLCNNFFFLEHKHNISLSSSVDAPQVSYISIR